MKSGFPPQQSELRCARNKIYLENRSVRIEALVKMQTTSQGVEFLNLLITNYMWKIYFVFLNFK